VRRWGAGQELVHKGVRYRVVGGTKFAGDLVLEWWQGGAWRKVPMSVGAILADFLYENEEHAFPRRRGFKGGNRYLGYIHGAALTGWQKAEALLEKERAQRNSRRVS